MAQGPSGTILVAIWITLRIQESKIRNLDPPDRRRFVFSECISCFSYIHFRAKMSSPPKLTELLRLWLPLGHTVPQFDVLFPEKFLKIVATRGEIFCLKFTK